MGIINRIASRIRGWADRERVRDARQIAVGGTGTSSLGSGFDLLSAYGYDALTQYLQLDHGLLERFADYEEMDDYPLIQSALDVYADDTTQEDMQSGRSVWVTAKDRRVQTMLDDLLYRTLGIEDERWEIARTLCKYGNDYEEPLITEEGLVGLNFLPPPTVRRIEGPRGELFGFIQDFRGKIGYTLQEFDMLLQQRGQKPQLPMGPSGMSHFDPATDMEWVAALEDWEVLHFRLRGKQRRSVYGHSVLEAARFIYRRLMLLEDAAMIFRLQRAPEKLAFYVNVGDLPSAEAMAHLRRVRNEHRKKKFVNPTTGRMDTKMDAFSQDEDYWIPSRDGTDSTRIETVTSPAWQHMEDINYFRDQLFAAMKIPKTYLGGDDGVVNSVLSSQDVRFARTILRVQREIKNGLYKACRLHLAAVGIHPDDVDFEIHMTVPSSIFELAQLEARNARADLAGRMKEFVSMPWLLKEVFGLSDQDVAHILAERDADVMRDAIAQAKAQAKAMQFGPPADGQGGPMQAAAGGGGGAPGEAAAFPLTRRRPAIVIHSARMGLSERDLNPRVPAGYERQMSGKLDKLLKNDAMLAARLVEVRDLARDLRHFQRAPAPRR